MTMSSIFRMKGKDPKDNNKTEKTEIGPSSIPKCIMDYNQIQETQLYTLLRIPKWKLSSENKLLRKLGVGKKKLEDRKIASLTELEGAMSIPEMSSWEGEGIYLYYRGECQSGVTENGLSFLGIRGFALSRLQCKMSAYLLQRCCLHVPTFFRSRQE